MGDRGGFGGGRGRGSGRDSRGDFNRRGNVKHQMGPAASYMEKDAPLVYALLTARPPIPFLPPPEVERHDAKGAASEIAGVGALVAEFEKTPPPPIEHSETPAERKAALQRIAKEENDARIAEQLSDWHPKQNPKATQDAYKTLFVSRLAYETTETKLRREFEEYGEISKVVIVRDLEGQSRGYGFIEYVREDDMKEAYRRGDGRRIDGRRVLVDVERGRTVRDFKPRRLGGGLGDTRRAVPKKPRKKDSWVRLGIRDYEVMDAKLKKKREADLAARWASAYGAGNDAAPTGGYRDRSRSRSPR